MNNIKEKVLQHWHEKSQKYTQKGDQVNAQRCVGVINLLNSQPPDVAISYINNELAKLESYKDPTFDRKILRILEEALTDAYKIKNGESMSTFHDIISTGRAVPVSDRLVAQRKQRYKRKKRGVKRGTKKSKR